MKNKFVTRSQFLKILAVCGTAGAAIRLGLDKAKGLITVSESRLLMGTIINLVVVADGRSAGELAITSTFTEMKRQIAILDHRSSQSPVGVLNQDGALADPPAELVEVLGHALAVSQLTNGAFDVTVKPVVELYKKAQPDLPDEANIQKSLELVNYRKLTVSDQKIWFDEPGMAITLDGIAKGYIVDAGVAKLKDLGYDQIFVDAGGDLMASGMNESGVPWRVGVGSPRKERTGTIASFSIQDKAVATSGDYHHYFSTDMINHHIINPLTGYSSTHIASSTVVGPNCLEADAFATALMVLDPEVGMSLLNHLPGIEGLLITKSLKQIKSFGFGEK